MFRIGDFSRLSSISIRMLRHYDKMDLLCPEQVDEATGFRYYAAAQLERAGQIQHLRQLGFSLAVIREMLASDTEGLERYFSLRQAEIEEELQQISVQAKLLDKAFELLKGDHKIMEYTVLLKDMPARKVASVRGTIADYSQEGLLWGRLYEGLHKTSGAKIPKEARMSAIFHDTEYKEADVDVEVQTEIDGDGTDAHGIRFYKTAPVQVASVTFSGSFDQMPEVTKAVATWIEGNGYRMDGAMFNIYHVGPGAEPDPTKWVTEACFPVTK